MVNNIIIFEGQDRCLKSTIINRLIQSDERHNYHTLHYGKPPKIANVQQYQQTTYRQMFELLHSGKDFILDRSHLGEMIWSPIYRNYDAKPFIQSQEKQWYENVKDKTNVFLFILVDSNYEKWKKRDDNQGLNSTSDQEKHETEIEHFRNSLKMTCIEKRFMFDLCHFYKENSDRIDDVALYNHIFGIISSLEETEKVEEAFREKAKFQTIER